MTGKDRIRTKLDRIRTDRPRAHERHMSGGTMVKAERLSSCAQDLVDPAVDGDNGAEGDQLCDHGRWHVKATLAQSLRKWPEERRQQTTSGAGTTRAEPD